MSAPGLIPKAGTDETTAHDRARREWISLEADQLRKAPRHPAARVRYRRPGLLEELRTAAPLFIPGILINRFLIRGVAVLLSPLVMAAPEIEKRIRPRVEQLCDISNPSWAVRAERAAWLWLLEERGTAPEPTEEAERQDLGGQACDSALQDLRQDTQMQPLADQATAEAELPTHLQAKPQSLPARLQNTHRGVR